MTIGEAGIPLRTATRSEKSLQLAGTLLSISALALVLLITSLSLSGFRATTINGPSMGGAARLGSLALFRPVAAEKLQPGDVIAVRRDASAPVVHRIAELAFSGGQLQATLRGDANAANDPQPVTLDGPVNRMTFSLPLLGFALTFIASTPGSFMLIGMPALASLTRSVWRLRSAVQVYGSLRVRRMAALWCTVKVIQTRRLLRSIR